MEDLKLYYKDKDGGSRDVLLQIKMEDLYNCTIKDKDGGSIELYYKR